MHKIKIQGHCPFFPLSWRAFIKLIIYNSKNKSFVLLHFEGETAKLHTSVAMFQNLSSYFIF